MPAAEAPCGARQLAVERRLAVAADRLADLAQRRARDALEVGDLAARRPRVGRAAAGRPARP